MEFAGSRSASRQNVVQLFQLGPSNIVKVAVAGGVIVCGNALWVWRAEFAIRSQRPGKWRAG